MSLVVIVSRCWAQIPVDQKAVELNNRAVAQMLMAYVDPGVARHVIALLDSAIRIDPLYEVAYWSKINLLCHLGKRSAALKTAQRLIEARPDYMDAWTWQGMILDRSGHVKEARRKYRVALAKYDSVLRRCPDSLLVRHKIARATVLLFMEGKTKGLKEFEKIAAEAPADKFVLMARPGFEEFDKKQVLRDFCR